MILRDFGPWTDLYAVGVLAWELVSAVTPFSGQRYLNLVGSDIIPRTIINPDIKIVADL